MWNQSLLRRWERGWFQEGRIKMKRTFCKSLLHRILSCMLGEQHRPKKGNYGGQASVKANKALKEESWVFFFLLSLIFRLQTDFYLLKKIWVFFLSRFLINCSAECVTSFCLLGRCYRGRDWEVHSFLYPLAFLGFPRWNFSFISLTATIHFHRLLSSKTFLSQTPSHTSSFNVHDIIPKRSVLSRKWRLPHMNPSCPSLYFPQYMNLVLKLYFFAYLSCFLHELVSL